MLPKFPLWLAVFFSCSALTQAACIPPNQAAKHVGETKCVRGKVTRIQRADDGAHYLQFCEEVAGNCSFSAVVFAEDLRHVGDIRQLQGKFIEVHGDVKDSDRGTQIIVSDAWQLKGEASSIPPLPKNYDVEKKGRYSAGVFSHPRSYATSKKRQTAKMPVMIPDDPPE
jgi:hypothetical protein